MATLKSFVEATAVEALSSHSYAADFPDDWCIGTVPNGGYITSVFLQVASAHFASTLSSQRQPHTVALHLAFLRRTQVGPALFTVKDVKLGRQTSVLHITLSQAGREEVVAYLTNSNIQTEKGVSFPTSYNLSPPPLPVDLKLLAVDKDPNWARKTPMFVENFRKSSKKMHFHFPRKGQISKSCSEEWVRLASSTEKWTNVTLGYVSDAFPLPVDSYIYKSNPYAIDADPSSSSQAENTVKLWFPTLLLNLDVKKALPDEGVEWLYLRTETKVIKNGRMDLEVVICDETGDVVAISNHIAYAVGSDRNVAKRRAISSSKI